MLKKFILNPVFSIYHLLFTLDRGLGVWGHWGLGLLCIFVKSKELEQILCLPMARITAFLLDELASIIFWFLQNCLLSFLDIVWKFILSFNCRFS
jgi:hypothetical protein